MVENNETLIVDVMLQIYRDMRDGEGDPLFEMLESVQRSFVSQRSCWEKETRS